MVQLIDMLKKESVGFIAEVHVKMNPLLSLHDLVLFTKYGVQMQQTLQAVKKFSGVLKMEFGIDKYTIAVFKPDKSSKTSNADLGVAIKKFDFEETHKHTYIKIRRRRWH